MGGGDGGARAQGSWRPDLTVIDRFEPRSERAFLERVVAATLEFADARGLEVALMLTDDEEIGRYHAEFLDDPTPTDVITFPRDDGTGVDLVVSVERAHRVAAETGHEFRHELGLYVIHGLLHVCGYDDLESDDRARMRDAERIVLARLGLEVAPVDAGGEGEVDGRDRDRDGAAGTRG